MTKPRNNKPTEPLYLVIIKDKNAHSLLQEWAQANCSSADVENNRLKLYEANSLNLFQLNWPHSWTNVTVWDCWNKRHI